MKKLLLCLAAVLSNLYSHAQILKIDFSTKDTGKVCSPHLYNVSYKTSLVDSSGKLYKGDSIVKWIWDKGDGSQKDTILKFDSSYRAIINYNGRFTFSLTCITAKGVSDTKTKVNFIYQAGPQPYFTITNDSGPAPLNVTINLWKTPGSDSASYSLHLGDGRIITTDNSNLKPTIKYLKAGIYYLTLTETDKVYDKLSNNFTNCGQTWPTSYNSPDSIRKVVVTTTTGIDNSGNVTDQISLRLIGRNLVVEGDVDELNAINVFSISGVLLINQFLVRKGQIINLSGLVNGVYLVRSVCKNGVIQKKIVLTE
jgi:hypothetical protein